eukprot:m.219868 g.219868  ORF g.219868 m.219868 type:complete len:77 (-) comp13826_c0_seq20:4167-4397(-)
MVILSLEATFVKFKQAPNYTTKHQLHISVKQLSSFLHFRNKGVCFVNLEGLDETPSVSSLVLFVTAISVEGESLFR